MRVWVTGAAGFVGRRLLPRLEEHGHRARGVDLEVDVTDPRLVARHVADESPDAIVHLAALSSASQSLRAAALTYRVNFLGVRSILEAARHHAPQARVLLVTSGEVYGSGAPGSAPFTESAPFAPRSPYARTKACADLLARSYADRGLDVVCARPFNHTGPGQTDVFVAPSFAKQVALIARGEREPLLRVGNLDSVRDFLDVSDVVDAYLRLLDPTVPAGAYNIASGAGRRIGDLLDDLLALAGVQPEIKVDPERLRPTDFAVGDPTRLRNATGWAPQIPWKDTLNSLLESALRSAA